MVRFLIVFRVFFIWVKFKSSHLDTRLWQFSLAFRQVLMWGLVLEGGAGEIGFLDAGVFSLLKRAPAKDLIHDGRLSTHGAHHFLFALYLLFRASILVYICIILGIRFDDCLRAFFLDFWGVLIGHVSIYLKGHVHNIFIFFVNVHLKVRVR